MPFLVCDGRCVAPLEVPATLSARSRGLLGRDGIEGAILLRPTRSIHTIGMRFAIDVAFCDRELRVIDVITMARNRLGRPRLTAGAVIEAEADAFGAWGVVVGSQLGVGA